jgi:hypothetical protein
MSASARAARGENGGVSLRASKDEKIGSIRSFFRWKK